MCIECITSEKSIIISITRDENGYCDFNKLSTLVERLLRAKIANEIALSFPDDFEPDSKQIGYIVLWGNTMTLRGANLGIITANQHCRERIEDLIIGSQIRLYMSEKEMDEVNPPPSTPAML